MRWIKALGALAALALLVVGLPLGLITFVGNPWPAGGVDLQQELTDEAIIGALAAAIWVLWAQLLVCIVVEVVAAVRNGAVDSRVPGAFGFQQQLARVLITSVVLAIGSGTMISLHTDPASAATFTPATTTSTITPATTATPAAADVVQAADEVADSGHTLTVQHGDTLWRLAEKHLGDGAEFEQIAKLNEGRTMPDGKVFRSSERLLAGWELRMPAGATGLNQADQAEDTEVQVEAGDSLWKIAEEQYGDGAEWPKIWKANKGEQFEDGRQFTDPDLIQPGWDLDLPSVTAAAPVEKAPAPKPVEEAPAPKVEAAPESPAQKAAPEIATPKADTEQNTQQEGQKAPQSTDVDDEGWPIRTTGGIGALLAAGVVGLLTMRRRRQQRNRQPGEEIALPEGDARAFEVEVRAVADPDLPGTIDAALRELAAHHVQTQSPLPEVQAVRVAGDQIELYLTGEAQLPDPWRDMAEGTAWARTLTGITGADLPAPYPSLVTVGQDDENGHVLLNVEHAQTISIDGPAEQTREHMAAIAVELATAPWAAEVLVTMCGAWPELVEVLGEDRARYVPSLEQLQLSHDRLQVVIVPDGASQELVNIAAINGAYVITAGGQNEWRVQIGDDGHAVINPIGLPIWAQVLNEQDRQFLVEVLGTALIEPGSSNEQPAPVFDVVEQLPEEPTIVDEPAAEAQTGAEAGDVDETAQEDVPPSVPESQPEPDPIGLPTASTPEQVVVPAVAEPMPAGVLTLDRTIQETEAVDETTAAAEPSSLLQTGHPVLRILGPVVQIEGAAAEPPSSESRKRVCTRIATFLALNPKATKPQLVEAVWSGRQVSDNTVDSSVSRLRSWLGANPETGAMYLPPRTLRLDDTIKTDWAIFTSTLGRDPRRATTEDLEAVLSLVQGRPLEGEDPKHYAFAEFETQHMISAVVDAAYELARRRYMEGRWRAVGEAAALGVLYEPGTERLWRIWIHAAHAAGNPPAVAEAIDRMHARISELGFDLEPKTEALIAAYERGDIDGLDQTVEGL